MVVYGHSVIKLMTLEWYGIQGRNNEKTMTEKELSNEVIYYKSVIWFLRWISKF